jgi:hypothetical protein
MDLPRLGKLGVWTFLDAMTAPQAAEFARRIEALGYSALWHPEAVGRDPVALIGFLAPQTPGSSSPPASRTSTRATP